MRRSIAQLSLAALLPLACASSGGPPVRGYLHAIVGPLPQCDYGVGYEQPLRVDLVLDDEVVATSYTSGTFLGAASLDVSLYAPDAVGGRYTIRFGRCPSMIDDPQASVACTDVDWFRSVRVRLEPRGLENPEVVRYYRVRARCMDPSVRVGSGRRPH
ncbi:MAG: hypothetical protein H6699_08220 [Myxococcales bacterium]|nr:hypothetical protein [Myxococcales bacterium]